MKFTAQQIAGLIGGTIEGNADATVQTFAKIEEGMEGAISFLANPKYEPYLYSTASSVVLVNNDFSPSQPVKATLIRVPNAYEAIARLLSFYESQMAKRKGIHPTAVIEESASVGEDCYIGPYVYIGEGVTVGRGTQIYAHSVVEKGASVGDDCLIYPNVSIYHECVIGSRVILHSGCVIGADGFGFAPGAEGYEKIPQIGRVEIEDDVEIGANTCVDRSTMGATRIHRGVKLDNLVQVAHNCEVGSHTVMSAQVGVAGSTKIGEWCMFGGQVGIAGHALIGDRTLSGAQAGIAGSIRKGHVTVQGSPAIDAKVFARASAVFKNLPEMYREFYRMKEELEALKAGKQE
ncbi:MAG: UDP-3-O-(3-hydroxymyristoyl)glucosamine N-acyltransferase [Bacteroidales bacterium]|nr:UDP-3-O-(3-hydroxymyristoyl)glucosamine N-acyltransferase [Bacteroidales bacterium]MCI6104358.1 UDP-3-O-(3-hydroxymyristoyl)glucosamine N-acyltransferase [Bacteroidales bacterium]MCI6251856.1 UDP-3-O-(3-hydroxymyristoyl)glucosamine N-acyltransferase [Bacteroidales bacterium]MDY5087570.1 UDP-3-O-(3-hydroxymyristoyl)glucosamine N-acyltransferase [Alloprevotella sp.]